LCVLYKNGSLNTNATWNEIRWVDVDRVGVHNQFGVGGFELDYGSVVWYPCSEIDNKTYTKPLWFVFIQFWAKRIVWYKDYITKATLAKIPVFREIKPCSGNDTGEWEIGWNGTVIYGSYSFPVYVGLSVRRDSPYMKIKTNVTTPVDLSDHAIEYQLYLNPYWKTYAEKNVEFVRVSFLNGTFTDYNISQAMDKTYDVPNIVYSFTFLNAYKNVTVNTFDFSDVFQTNGTKLAKIEQVALPNGAVIQIWPFQKVVFNVEGEPVNSVSESQTASVTVQITTTEITTGFWRKIVATDRFQATLASLPYVDLTLLELLTNNIYIKYTIEIMNKLSTSLTLTLKTWITPRYVYQTVLASNDNICEIPPLTNRTFEYTLAMPISTNVFTALGNLNSVYMLHVVVIDAKAKLQTEELVATIQIDATKAIVQGAIIVVAVCVIVIVVYLGIRKKKVKDFIESIK